MWGWRKVEILSQSLRLGARQLRRSPGFTAVAVLTLALGIGVNTAIFSVMNAVMLRTLPVREPRRLVVLHSRGVGGTNRTQTGFDETSFPEPVFTQLRSERRVLTDLIAFAPLGTDRVAVRYGAAPEAAHVDMVSGNFFSGLGVATTAGRVLSMEDETGHAPVAVLSYDYWARRLARSPAVLGQAIDVKGIPFTIVGITAPGFAGPEFLGATDLWVPLQTRPELKPWGVSAADRERRYGTPNWWCLMLIGRLAPGVTARQAEAALSSQFRRAAFLGEPPPKSEADPLRLAITPLRGIQELREAAATPLGALMAMVGLVQLIACGNVAMLLVARNAARQRELSVRIALGGGRGWLLVQLLAESLLLVVAGAALGWLLALWTSQALAAWMGLGLDLAPDSTVLGFTLVVSLLTGLLFGLAPLRHAVRAPVGLALRASTATALQGGDRGRGGQAVVALQMAICLVMLVCAGLLVRTLRNLESEKLGMRASALLVFGLDATSHSRSADPSLFYRPLLARLRALPGVEAASLMESRLGSDISNNTPAVVDGARPAGKGSTPMMRWNLVGPDYFHTLGVPVLLGRDFAEADAATAPKAAIVNHTFAERYLQKRPPLGHRIALSREPGAPQFAIVGVVADSKYCDVREEALPIAYLPYTQASGEGTLHLVLRTGGDPAALLPSVRRAVGELAPDLPLLQPMTLQQQFQQSYRQDRLIARLALFFGLLSALLVATGLFGTLAIRVSRRTAEIGVRMALGAGRLDIQWMVLRASLGTCLAGAVVGAPLAVACARLLRSQLFGLQPGDPAAFAAAVAGITLVALAASVIPAHRAASVDPIVAVRSE